MSVTIYHNPRCSKSRKTLELIQEQGIAPKIIEYLQTPPTAEELRQILSKLGIEARQLMRRGEAVYKEKGLDDPSISEEELIQAMVENPILIERPVVLATDKAVIGRPPESVLSIV